MAHSIQRVLDVIRQDGPISRTQLAQRLELSKPTVSAAVRSLLATELIFENGHYSGEIGRRSILLHFNAQVGYLVGMDIGGTFARAAISDLQGNIINSIEEHTCQDGTDALLRQLHTLFNKLCTKAKTNRSSVVAVALSTPGVLDSDQQCIRYAPNLSALESRGFIERLNSLLGIQVRHENDVNIATLGEKWQGAGKQVSNFIFMNLGTGLGLGLYFDDRLYRGSAGRAGEFGYAPLYGQNNENLESILCGAAIAQAHQRAGGSGRSEDAFDEAMNKIEPGATTINNFLGHVGFAAATLSTLLDPELIVLGGGVGVRCQPFLNYISSQMAQYVPIVSPLAVSKLGREAGVHGALAVAQEESMPLAVLKERRRKM